MQVTSLAFKTDLFFHRSSGSVTSCENCLVVKTPDHPTFFWGNFLYFSSPPKENDLLEWKAKFHLHFKAMEIDHMAFAWESPEGQVGEIEQFLSDGFEIERSAVMSASHIIRPAKMLTNLLIRPIASEAEWEQVIDNQVFARDQKFTEGPYRKFTIKKMNNYKKMIEEKKGLWMGAFFNGKLVGDLGIFYESGLARFQAVVTHPDFRRLGVCSTLLYKTCQYAGEHFRVSEFVIVADPDYHAAAVYESLGFKTCETQVGLCKYNKEIWAT